MRPFSYARVDDAAGAVRAAARPGTAAPVIEGMQPVQYLAGGTNIVDCMKLDVMRPTELVDINGLQAMYGGIKAGPDGCGSGRSPA